MIYSINKEHPTRHFYWDKEYDYTIKKNPHSPRCVDVENGETAPLICAKDVYFLGWGIFATMERNYEFELHDYDGSALISAARKAEIYEEEGKKGWKDSDGNIVIPALFSQLEVGRDWVFLKRENNDCCLVNRYGGYSQWNAVIHARPEGNFFIRDGKMGWIRDGEVILAAEYDNIVKWYGYDVYAVEQGGCRFYVDGFAKEVFVDSEENYEPCSHDHDNITIQELTDETGGNVVRKENGMKVKAHTCSVQEAISQMKNAKVKALTSEELELVQDDCSYEYSAYKVSSNGNDRVKDCLDKLFRDLGAGSNTWHYLILVASGKEYPLLANELREIRRHFQGMTKCPPISVKIAIDQDESISDNSLTISMITHYYDGGPCFGGPKTLTDFWIEGDVDSFCRRVRYLARRSKGEELPEQARVFLYNLHMRNREPWKSSKPMLDYFAEHFSIAECGGNEFVGMLDGALGVYLANISSEAYYAHLLKWGLEHGLNPNIVEDGDTVLDRLNRTISEVSECTDPEELRRIGKIKMNYVRKTRELVLAYGGKTKVQLLSEEPEDADFQAELKLLRML